MVGEGFPGYSEACKCIDDLRLSGIESGLTGGGIWIGDGEIDTIESIVKRNGGVVLPGNSTTTTDLTLLSYRMDKKRKQED